MATPSPGLEIGTSTWGAKSWAFADWAGMTASIGCAIHCAAMPLVIAYLPALGLRWLADEGFHQYMAIICIGLAVAAFVPGWRKHRSLIPLAWGASGLILLNAAAFGLECNCCPHAEAKTESAAMMACTDHGYAAERCNAAACGADGCSECKATVKAAGLNRSFVEAAVPLVTPFGGLLLIVGHILNHQKRCRCQGGKCCYDLTGVAAGTDAKLAAIATHEHSDVSGRL